MHPVVTDEDIRSSETFLFGKTGVFNAEQKAFIQNLDTIDLHAVPGSGKTTALMAKLYILNNYQPFTNGAGILVLSHTNVAVDIFKTNFGDNWTLLNSFPNFVGTIQSFIDVFIAIPYFAQFCNRNPKYIDSDVYNATMDWRRKVGILGVSPNSQRLGKGYLNIHENKANQYRFELFDDGKVELTTHLNGPLLVPSRPKKKGDSAELTAKKEYTDEEKTCILDCLKKLKSNIWREEGIMHYDDAYFLAKYNLSKNKMIKILLQNRFRYVFIDEMQDMEKHQLSILEDIFGDKLVPGLVFQRIGDRNQAIYANYSQDIHTDAIWNSRENHLSLSQSLRLSSNIAKCVSPFALEKVTIVGKNDKSNKCDIKSKIILYDETNIGDVVTHFGLLIKDVIDKHNIPLENIGKCKAIGWVKEKPVERVKNSKKSTPKADELENENTKAFISTYTKHYVSKLPLHSTKYDTLSDWLHHLSNDTSKDGSNNYNSILWLLVKLINFEGNKVMGGESQGDKRFTVHSLKNHIKSQDTAWRDVFLLNLFNLCRTLRAFDKSTIKAQLTTLVLNLTGESKLTDKSIFFMDSTGNGNTVIDTQIPHQNIVNVDGVEIEIATIHSVKGETHFATLYLETAYYAKSESERLFNQLKGLDAHSDSLLKTREKQTAKMMFVGFSRPTHLLCFACHKNHIGSFGQELEQSGWEIIDLTIKNVPAESNGDQIE